MLVYGRNPDLQDQEHTYVASTIEAGASVFTVKSTAGFSQGQLIVIGDIGQEKTELKQIAAVDHTNNTITLKTSDGWSGFLYSHATDSTIIVTPYDQIDFYRASAFGGSYEYIATVNIDIDDEFTKYDHFAGLPTDYYKVRFKNSITGNVSEFSGEVAAAGYDSQSVGSIIDDLRTLLGDRPSDEDLLRFINLAQEAIYAAKDRWYFTKKKETYLTVDSKENYNFPEDYISLDSLYEYVAATATWAKLKYVDYDNFKQNYQTDVTEQDTAAYYTIDEMSDQIIIRPIPKDGGNTLEMTYYSGPTALVQYTDTTPIPSPRAIVFWVASKIEASRGNADKSKIYWNEYQNALNSIANKRLSPTKSFYVR